jgi:hypothetical protein
MGYSQGGFMIQTCKQRKPVLMFIGRSYGERKTELGKLICIFYARVRRLDFPLKKNTRTDKKDTAANHDF